MLDRRPYTTLAFCTIFFAVAGFAQNAAPLDPNALYKLEGAVVNGQTGRPLPHALVEIYGRAKVALLTDSEGRFTFEKLPAGTLALTTRKPGFYGSGATDSGFLRNIEIGPKTGKLELKLVPEAGFSGEVTDSDGEPLEGVSAQVLAIRFIEGRRQLMPMGRNARTDEDGNFHIAGLPAGRYYLSVKPEAAARRLLGEQSSSVTTAFPAMIYFPAANELAGATPFDLAPGQRTHVTFTLKRVPAFKVAGVVTGASAYKQIGHPMMVDDSGQQLFGASRWDRETGTFEFPPIPSGRYNLQMYAADEANHPAWLRETITVDHNVADLNLVLQPAISIAIVVRNELGPHPQPSYCSGNFGTGQGQSVDCSRIPAMVNLVSVDWGHGGVSSQPMSATDPSLVLNGVMPGRYIVRAMPTVSGHVQSIRSGGIDLLREPLIVAAGGQVSPIEVVLRDDGGWLKVRVRSEDIPKEGRLLLFPEFAPNLPPTILDIGSNGEREYGDLAPGPYKIFAFDSIDGIEYGNPEAMEKYAAKAGNVTITSHGTAMATVDLIHTGE